MQKLLVFVIVALAHAPLFAQHSLEKLWESDSLTLKGPESVPYDSKSNLLYVSSMGSGSVVQMGLDGKVIKNDWVTGLNSNKGSALFNGKFYTTETAAVAVVDVATAKVIKRIPVEGAVMLNDLTVDAKGVISACSSAQTEDNHASTGSTVAPDKVLIVYLSRTNNTKAVAEIIHKQVGGTLVALELKKPYPQDYQATVQQVVDENESGFLPPLKTKIDNIQKYDVVFVGFPTWGMKLPPPMKSFLKQYDLSGKTIVPFNTNAGYGVGSSFETVKALCPNSTVLEGFSTKGGVERDGVYFVMEGEKAKEAETEVKKWLQKIGLLKQ